MAVIAYCIDDPSSLIFQSSFNAIEVHDLSYVVVKNRLKESFVNSPEKYHLLSGMDKIYFDQAFYSAAYHPEMYDSETISSSFKIEYVSSLAPQDIGTTRESLERGIAKSISTN